MEILVEHIYRSAVAMMAIGVPVLLVAGGLGLLTGLLQAVTQIQDSTFPQIIKILAVSALLLFFGHALSGPIVTHSEEIFATFHKAQTR
ncbi:MAG: flagellar biosynthetic protein FliQ [Bosea sp. (in: a-proteobacteria)]